MDRREATEFARADFACGSFDALRATHFQHRFPPHFHDTFAIGVVESGITRLRTHRGAWVASGGTILAFSPGEIHSAEPIGEEGFTYRMVYPSAGDLAAAGFDVARAEGGVPLFRTPVIDDASLAAALRRAHVPLMRGVPRGVAETRLLGALRLLVRDYGLDTAGGGKDDARSGEGEMVAMVQRYLQARLATRVRLRPLADLCGVSCFRLIRSFRRVIGVSPYAYFVQLRVNRAQAMLCDGSSMRDVVYSCGFSDQSHFTRAFKRMIGVPPGRYARAVRRHTSERGVVRIPHHAG
jgi:AraC-like DNA-binding protein